MDHGEEVGGELVIASSDAAKVLQLREVPLDQIALAVELLAEVGLPAPVTLGRNVGRGTAALYQLADAVSIISLVSQYDGARAETVEQCISDLSVMRLSGGQREPDWEAFRIDDRVDFGRKPASGAAETMISIPFFAVAAC